jgi:anaerobic selenocysteine-containing dehydrogenase
MPGSARVSPIRLGASLPAVPLSAGEEILRTADQPHGVAVPGELEPPSRPSELRRGASQPDAVPLPSRGDGLILMTAPLLLGSGTMLARSQLIDAESLGAIELNPGDAAARSIAAGDVVEVRTAYGTVAARSLLVAAMPAGRAFLAENAPGVRTNVLLSWNDLLPSAVVTKR